MNSISQSNFSKFDELNVKLTEELLQDQKSLDFIKWVKDNGGYIHPAITFMAFSKMGYRGIGATQNIKENTLIIAIPNRILITTFHVDASPLKFIIRENPLIFKDNEDGEFNKISLFIYWEKIKGQESFYHPWFQMTPINYTINRWKNNDVNLFGDPYISMRNAEIREEMDEWLQEFIDLLHRYPLVFPELNKEELIWSHEYTMTRCFGWYLPSTMVVPFADHFNHKRSDVLINLVDMLKEKNLPQNYKPQLIDCDKSLVIQYNWNSQKISMIDKKKLRFSRISYITEKQQYLDEPITREELNRLTGDKLLTLIKDINFKLLKQDEHIFEQDFFSSDNSEDNDTDGSDEDTIGKSDEFKKLKWIESQKVKLSENVEKEIKNQRYQNNKKDNEGANYDWYSKDNEDAYFTVQTKRGIKVGEQIYTSYGKRTARFLLLYYGFCTLCSPEDSFAFRLLTSCKELDMPSSINKALFLGYVGKKEFDLDEVKFDNQLIKTNMLTKMFRLKSDEICDDLLIYIRMQLLQECRDMPDVMLTLPSDLYFEIKVLQRMELILKEIMKKVKIANVDEELESLEREELDYKVYMATVYKVSRCNILIEQMKIVKIAQIILERLVVDILKGQDFQKATIEVIQQFDLNEASYRENRIKTKSYCEKVYAGIIKLKQRK